MEEKKLDFEKSLTRLDEIVSKIETETLPLEESLKLYEEGRKLIASLEDALKEAEQKIKDLQK